MILKMIAFDADDTLWHNEINYRKAVDQLSCILAPWADPAKIDDTLNQTEMGNMAMYGYGVKAFTLSMLETAVTISGNEIDGKVISQILAIGHEMLQAKVTLLPQVADTLRALSLAYPLMVITKGDILDQTNKIRRSGLESFFSQVEVVGEKTPDVYREILLKNSIDPECFLMVGNSIRSDILPVLSLGGNAVYIPADTTWAHEMVKDFDPTQPGFYTLNSFGALPEWLDRFQ